MSVIEAAALPKEIASLLEACRRPLICSHVRLDGDGVGSELGLAHLLSAQGKRPYVVNDGRIPAVFDFLPGAQSIATSPVGTPDDCDAVVALDAASLDRLGKVADRLPRDVPGINIDHHDSNESFLQINWVDPSRSSVGEMLYVLAELAGWPLPAEAATALYVAVITDTGRFTLPNTTPESLRVAAALIERGARHVEVGDRLYRAVPLAVAHLKGLTLTTVQSVLGGRVATARVTREMFEKTGAEALDTQEFSEIPRSVAGAVVGVLLREMEDGQVKVSLRGRPGYDVQQVARKFGGGGHPGAAGCVIAGCLDEVERRVLEELAPVVSCDEAMQ